MLKGSGPNAKSLVTDIAGTDPGVVVHRAALLRELLVPLPSECLHPSKKLSAIHKADDGHLILSFEDGTIAHADALNGADGIFGFVQQYVLGDDPSSGPTPAGWWDSRNLVPIEKAKQKIGTEFFEHPRQYG